MASSSASGLHNSGMPIRRSPMTSSGAASTGTHSTRASLRRTQEVSQERPVLPVSGTVQT